MKEIASDIIQAYVSKWACGAVRRKHERPGTQGNAATVASSHPTIASVTELDIFPSGPELEAETVIAMCTKTDNLK